MKCLQEKCPFRRNVSQENNVLGRNVILGKMSWGEISWGEMLQGKKSFGRNIAEPPRGSKRLLGTQMELQGTQIELLRAQWDSQRIQSNTWNYTKKASDSQEPFETFRHSQRLLGAQNCCVSVHSALRFSERVQKIKISILSGPYIALQIQVWSLAYLKITRVTKLPKRHKYTVFVKSLRTVLITY